MAIRIRTNGRMFCAAHRPAELGDIYVDDAVHYHLSSVARVLVSEGMEKHLINPEWWWRHDVPSCVEIADHYRTAISSAAEAYDYNDDVSTDTVSEIRAERGVDISAKKWKLIDAASSWKRAIQALRTSFYEPSDADVIRALLAQLERAHRALAEPSDAVATVTVQEAARVLLTGGGAGTLVTEAYECACDFLSDDECGDEITNEIIETFLHTLAGASK